VTKPGLPLWGDLRVWAGLGLLLLLACYLFGGDRGLLGGLLGLVGTAFNNWGLWQAIRLIGGAQGQNPLRPGEALFATAAFLTKLPLFIILAWTALRVGGPAIPCFLLGLGLVYCATFGWALARGRDHSPT
jgi:hypothetical protein